MPISDAPSRPFLFPTPSFRRGCSHSTLELAGLQLPTVEVVRPIPRYLFGKSGDLVSWSARFRRPTIWRSVIMQSDGELALLDYQTYGRATRRPDRVIRRDSASERLRNAVTFATSLQTASKYMLSLVTITSTGSTFLRMEGRFKNHWIALRTHNGPCEKFRLLSDCEFLTDVGAGVFRTGRILPPSYYALKSGRNHLGARRDRASQALFKGRAN